MLNAIKSKLLGEISLDDIKVAIDNSPQADIIYREIGKAVVSGLISATKKAGINIMEHLLAIVSSNLKSKIQ